MLVALPALGAKLDTDQKAGFALRNHVRLGALVPMCRLGARVITEKDGLGVLYLLRVHPIGSHLDVCHYRSARMLARQLKFTGLRREYHQAGTDIHAQEALVKPALGP